MSTSTIVKATKCKLGPFDHAISMSKWPTRSVCAGSIIYYLTYLPDPFPRGLKVDLEGSSTFPTLMLSMHIDLLGFFVTCSDIYSTALLYGRVPGLVLHPLAWKLSGTTL